VPMFKFTEEFAHVGTGRITPFCSQDQNSIMSICRARRERERERELHCIMLF